MSEKTSETIQRIIDKAKEILAVLEEEAEVIEATKEELRKEEELNNLRIKGVKHEIKGMEKIKKEEEAKEK